MMTLQDPEYRRLARESSNRMLRYDGEWVQGNYEEAGLALWEAGLLRLQMAASSRREKDPCRALANFLSAASCFIRIGNVKWAERAFAYLAEEGKIPPERPDLAEALAERQGELLRLVQQQKRFAELVEQHPEWLREPPAGAFDSVREHLRDFPAWARLYAVLAYLENERGDVAAAARHADLAAQFDPEQPLLVCVALIARARVEPIEAVLAWGQRQLERFPDSVDLRIVLAYLHALQARDRTDYREVQRQLEPLARDPGLSPGVGILLLALGASVAGEVGDERLRGEAVRELERARSRLGESALAAPLAGELKELIDRVLETEHAENGRGDGTGARFRKSLRGLEKTLTLLLCAAA